MKKKLLIFLIIIGLIFSLFTLISRYKVENNNKNVELVIDYRSYQTLLENDIDINLSFFKDRAVNSVAVYEDDLKYLINTGDIRYISGNEFERTQQLTGSINPLLKDYDFDHDSAFMFVKNEKTIKRLIPYLEKWVQEYNLRYSKNNNNLIIFFPRMKHDFFELSTGISKDIINEIKEAGLEIIPRYKNDKSILFDEGLNSDFDFETIIFSGSEISGYPDKLDNIANLMQKNDINFGIIEAFIAYQKGANTVAKKMNYKLLRVHSIQQAEMEKYSLSKIVNRYIRAVKERDVRILYIKFFQKAKGELDISSLNSQYLKELSNGLKNEGFEIAISSSFNFFRSSSFVLLIIGVGIIAAGILLLHYFELYKWDWLLFIILFIILLIFLFTGKVFLLRKILALGASIIFPAYAIISQVLFLEDKQSYFIKFLKTGLLSLVGAVFLAASLSHVAFMYGVEQFRGVKLAFVLPLFLISFYYYQHYLNFDIIHGLKSFYNASIRVKHLIFFSIVTLGGIIYLARTGNYSLIPVLEWENVIREGLENLLRVRPRFKEFLFGHPFLLLALYFKDKVKGLFYYLILILASIGQITLVNTFAHIHTPLKISFVRIFHAYWLGLILGLIFIVILTLIIKAYKRLER